jgi:hypothetical protein
MKVGDLVKLSAYAKKLKQFYNGRENDVGVVIKQAWYSMYAVRWCSDGKMSTNMARRDLKHVGRE